MTHLIVIIGGWWVTLSIAFAFGWAVKSRCNP